MITKINHKNKTNKKYISSRRETNRLFAADRLKKGQDLVEGIPNKLENVDYRQFILSMSRVMRWLFGIPKTKVEELLAGYNRRCVHPIMRKEIKVIVGQGFKMGSIFTGPVH